MTSTVQPRHGGDDPAQDVAAQLQQGGAQLIAPDPGMREQPQHIGKPAIGEQQDHQPGEHADDADLQVAEHLAPLMGDQPLLLQQVVGEPATCPLVPPPQQLHHHQKQQGHQQRLACRLEQVGVGVQLQHFDPHIFQPQPHPFCGLIQGQLIEPLQIFFQQHQQVLVIESELSGLLTEAGRADHGHRMGQILGLQLPYPLLDDPHPGRPVQATKLRLQHHYGFVKQGQGLGLLLLGRLQSRLRRPPAIDHEQGQQHPCQPDDPSVPHNLSLVTVRFHHDDHVRQRTGQRPPIPLLASSMTHRAHCPRLQKIES